MRPRLPSLPQEDPPPYCGRALTVRRERHALPDGRVVALDVVRYRDVATVVPLLPDRRVVLLRQYRPVVGVHLWEVPAGTLEPGESPEAAAQRELAEEAGYRAGRLELLGVAWADPGLTDERMFLFVASGLTPVPRDPDPDEDIEVAPTGLDEAFCMIETGAIQDAGTLIALLRLRACPWLLDGSGGQGDRPSG